MPLQARAVLPDTPHYIMQRGYNGQVVFVSDDDFEYDKPRMIFASKATHPLLS